MPRALVNANASRRAAAVIPEDKYSMVSGVVLLAVADKVG